jgi:hypothetical protein
MKWLILLFIPLISFSQDLFFMGESSYQSTKSGVLESEIYGENLTVLFAKNNDSKYIVVQTRRILDYRFINKLTIYLNNGDVISINEPYNTDYVNETSTGMFSLTDKNVDKLKNTNINSIGYSLKAGSRSPKFLAKNTGIDTAYLIREF